MMEDYAHGATEIAANSYGVQLDYSEDSIKRMETIFNSLHNEIPKGLLDKLFKRGLTENQINSAALMLGAYIGVVIRKIHGGEWVMDDTMGKKDVIGLHIGQTRIFPVAKAHKRIMNGSEDDVWFYYEVFKSKLL